MRPRLVLWDIDGTLVDSARLGLDAFLEAFEAVTGRQPAKLVPFAGRTDLEIAHDMLAASDVRADDGLLDRFEEELVRAMAARLDELASRGRALPGTAEALERVGSEPGVIQSLLTGNVERNAMLKLKPFGLAAHVEFGCGAYGSDHRVRGELVPIARARAERAHGVTIARSDVILIGDTPLDVAAAHEGGARAVGVATGPYDEASLHAAGADAVLPDLSDTEGVVAAILGSP
ncbi:MAG TPA: haloacid dehalogenase-like hydrolase [Thermoleophilaceae bacterium]|jgi:phosphoglycolate phosphatase-like HAD superfamily hydrolase